MLPVLSLSLVFLLDIAYLSGGWYYGAFSSVYLVLSGLAVHIAVSAVVIRALNRLYPIPEGEFKVGSPEFNHWQAQAVIALFSSVYFDYFLPMPLKAAWFRLFGAKIAPGVVVSGRIVDCSLVSIEKGSTIGLEAVILGHWMAQDTAYLGRVRIEQNALIGARSIILPGVHINRGATVGIGALVTSDKQIPPGETWAGVPAKPLFTSSQSSASKGA
jgi:acetyltransferase-like isoleucine patch superfamily enzyme